MQGDVEYHASHADAGIPPHEAGTHLGVTLLPACTYSYYRSHAEQFQ